MARCFRSGSRWARCGLSAFEIVCFIRIEIATTHDRASEAVGVPESAVCFSSRDLHVCTCSDPHISVLLTIWASCRKITHEDCKAPWWAFLTSQTCLGHSGYSMTFSIFRINKYAPRAEVERRKVDKEFWQSSSFEYWFQVLPKPWDENRNIYQLSANAKGCVRVMPDVDNMPRFKHDYVLGRTVLCRWGPDSVVCNTQRKYLQGRI